MNYLLVDAMLKFFRYLSFGVSLRRLRFIALFSLLSALCATFYAQAQTDSSKAPRLSTEPLYLVDLPTAGMLYHRNFSTSLEFLNNGGIVMNGEAGFFNRLMVGIAYGGNNVIGDQKAVFNPHIGLLIRVRALEESYYIPAIVVGFSSQGKGAFIDSLNRYNNKSPGLYAVASKNFDALGSLSVHVGAHYSLEDADNNALNFYGGVEKTFASIFSGMLEYDNGFILSKSKKLDKGNGQLNLGVRATIGSGFILGMNVKDLLHNRQEASVGERTIYIQYTQTL